MKIKIQNMAAIIALILAAIMSMGDGGSCVPTQPDPWIHHDYYKVDICGDKDPFYWKASKPNAEYDIKLVLHSDTGSGFVNSVSVSYNSGIYSDSIYLDCKKLIRDDDNYHSYERK